MVIWLPHPLFPCSSYPPWMSDDSGESHFSFLLDSLLFFCRMILVQNWGRYPPSSSSPICSPSFFLFPGPPICSGCGFFFLSFLSTNKAVRNGALVLAFLLFSLSVFLPHLVILQCAGGVFFPPPGDVKIFPSLWFFLPLFKLTDLFFFLSFHGPLSLPILLWETRWGRRELLSFSSPSKLVRGLISFSTPSPALPPSFSFFSAPFLSPSHCSIKGG